MTGEPTHRNDIARLIAVARRELADAAVSGLSPDGSFEHAYAAALAIATSVVRASGRRIHAADHHRLTFDELGTLADGRWSEVADYLQLCRRRRNTSRYDRPGVTSAAEAEALRKEAAQLLDDVIGWLRREHPDLVP